MAKTIFEKNKVKQITLFDFKTFHKAIVRLQSIGKVYKVEIIGMQRKIWIKSH